ncbi:WD40-repeat-containing domain protein [Suillus occidentalis]|nr:WD40-repeat-containing domain protein [Suillus occidentalis]
MSGRLLVTWIRRWTAAQWEEPILRHKFQGHEGAIWSLVFLHDNVHIVSGSEDGTIRKWNCNTGLAVGEPWKGGGGKIYALALSPDGKTIACGREDGSVQRWNTDGEMMEGIWTNHGKAVRSLSWSPSGGQITSGSDDGTIVIRNAESGKVEMGPIKTEQKGVCALAYSHSGERIASGGDNYTICIWDTKTGELVVGPIKGLGLSVTSLLWSSDSTKLYSTSDRFARVFDSTTGKLLHRFEHDRHRHLYSVALSPRQNVLACVGSLGVAQLWDTESNQPLGQPFDQQNYNCHYCVSFSRDGNSLAFGGSGKKLSLWTVKDIPLQLPAPALLQQSGDKQSTQQETRPNSPSSSCLNADATGGGDLFEEAHDLYSNFFQSSQKSLPLPSSGSRLAHLFSARRLLNFFSRCCPPEDESIPKERPKRGFFSRRACLNASLEPAPITPNQPVPKRKVGQGDGKQVDHVDHRASAHNSLSATKDKGKQRYDGPAADAQSLPSDNPTPLVKLDCTDNRNILAQLMRRQGKNLTSVKIAPTIKHPEVVEVYATRGFRRLVVMKRKRKTKLLEATYNIPLVAPNSSGSSPAGQLSQVPGAPPAVAHVGGSLSPHSVPVQAGMSSHAMGGNGSPVVTAVGGPHASPSHFVTNYHTRHDSDSRSSIEGSCNKFLDRICFPCGHYHEDS